MICQKPNKTEDESLFDVIFLGPMFSLSGDKKSRNKTELKNLTALSLSFDDGFKVRATRGCSLITSHSFGHYFLDIWISTIYILLNPSFCYSPRRREILEILLKLTFRHMSGQNMSEISSKVFSF